MNRDQTSRGKSGSFGPAIIVASVVLGPGSILTSSRVGCDFGYGLLWVVIVAVILMIGMTAVAARIGTGLSTTPCEEIARRAGRPLAALIGIVLFAVVACFQFSNNVAVVAALEPYTGRMTTGAITLLVALNVLVLAALFGCKNLYRPVEWTMKILVGLMMIAFLGNAVLARPEFAQLVAGFVPRLPEGLASDLLPRRSASGIVDPLLPVQGLIGTTFSVAGAFYQAYLVRQKGWTNADLRRGFVDSVVGISVLAFLTLTVMVTAAAVLHGEVAGRDLASASDVAVQLEPLFGSAAKLLFSLGLLAGAFSSFLVNVMIGGTILSDGLGFGGDMDRRGPRSFTAVALICGMVVALAVLSQGSSTVELVIFAQALTVLGNPILAGVLLWLSMRVGTPRWLQAIGLTGFVVVLALAVRLGFTLTFKLT